MPPLRFSSQSRPRHLCKLPSLCAGTTTNNALPSLCAGTTTNKALRLCEEPEDAGKLLPAAEIEIVAGERGDVPHAARCARVSVHARILPSVNITDTRATHTHRAACKPGIHVFTPHYYTASIQHYTEHPYRVLRVHDTPFSYVPPTAWTLQKCCLHCLQWASQHPVNRNIT